MNIRDTTTGAGAGRAAVLDQARDAVTRDRAAAHGRAEDSFAAIAALWSADLGVRLGPVDVARLMVLFKAARARGNPGHADNWVDMAGYAAIGGELGGVAAPASVRMEATVELDARGWPHATLRAALSKQGDRDPGEAAAPPAPGPGDGEILRRDTGAVTAEGSGAAAEAESAPPSEAAAPCDPAPAAADAPVEVPREPACVSRRAQDWPSVADWPSAAEDAAEAEVEVEVDLDDLAARVLAGETVRDVALGAGMDPRRLAGKVTAARKREAKAALGREALGVPDDDESPGKAADTEPPAPAVATDVSSEVATPETGGPDAEHPPAVCPGPRAYADMRVNRALAEEGGDWSSQEDVVILRGFTAGENSCKISQKLKGRSAADVVNRYKALVPRASTVAQVEALRRAEARVQAAG